MTDRTDINIDALRQLLLARRADLEAHSKGSAESRDAVELDQTRQGRLSRQDALMQQEMAKETERRRQLDIQRIGAALGRMECGDYGYCARCDEPIAAKRLELDPALATCINCAEKGS
ncbi:MAG: TraR/DksA C4-type zinc finger protein [Rhodospirillales bacterium]|nr:TraR/DksA C4-type zinc finger protein [Rhodospirillales bacterium]MCB9995103.1 TraR/DksA C4-type zinc finger protein [Rhodospirillales bacterium]